MEMNAKSNNKRTEKMKIRIDDFDLNGKVMPGSGKIYTGTNALGIVEQMNAHPFTASLSPMEFMQRYLDQVGESDFALPDDPEKAAQAFLQHLVNCDYANFELGKDDTDEKKKF